MTAVDLDLGLGVKVTLQVPDEPAAGDLPPLIYAALGRLGPEVARHIGLAVADLARMDDAVDYLATCPEGERRAQADGIREQLRGVRDRLRPVDVELWRTDGLEKP